jgi:hypothetical protein
MFSRRQRDSAAATQDGADSASSPDSGLADEHRGKGRPTPTRKEAEQARKDALRTPSDPRAARKAAKARERQARMENRAALLAGDESKLPVRDQGPVRRFTRDFVDSRFTVAEYFIFIALAVLVLGFIPNQAVQSIVSLAWFILIAVILVDSTILVLRLRSQLRQRFPDKAERRGALFYAIMRTLQLRRLRLPPPKVKRGGAPVTPKGPSGRGSRSRKVS